MKRITDANLEAVCARINRLTASPLTPYTDNKPNIGAFLINHQYGRVQLARIACPNGGERDALSIGYVTKRELYNAMFAFIAGLETSGRAAA